METLSSQTTPECQRPTLYLDVDGVLFHNGKKTYNIRPLLGEFLLWCNDNFECCWMTAWPEVMVRQLTSILYVSCAGRWKYPPLWKNKKTESMDFNKDFVWVDDNASEAEIEDIKLFHRQGRLQEVVHVDPNPCDLLPWIQEQLEGYLCRWRTNERLAAPFKALNK